MTDKVQKIREEVERLRSLHQMKYQQLDTDSSMSLVECGKRNLCNELLSFIDSLLEEPVSEDLEEASWLYADKKALLGNNVFTPNALEKERTRLSFDWYDIRETFKAGAQWKGKIAKKEVIEKAVTWIKEHKEAVETEDNGIMGWIPDYFIEDFKKALEGDSV